MESNENPIHGSGSILDGLTHAYWMIRMHTYFKSIDLGLLEVLEHLIMRNDEEFQTCFANPMDISNDATMLGDPINNKSMVRKTIFPLPPWFNMKVCALGEGHAHSIMEFTKFSNILTNHDMNQVIQQDALDVKTLASQSKYSHKSDYEEYILEVFDANRCKAYILKKATKLSIELHKSKDSFLASISKQSYLSSSSMKGFCKPSKSDSKRLNDIQCHACGGWGHCTNECALTLRKTGNNYWLALKEVDEIIVEDQSGEEDLISLSGRINEPQYRTQHLIH